MDDPILITELNDFIFCPVSIYFHQLYGSIDKMLYQSRDQINGTAAHEKVDDAMYSTKKSILMGIDVYCEEYNLIGKIDMYDQHNHLLRERKKKIKQVYDGYIYQVYAQCFALREMGYEVDKIELYSMEDHKVYNVDLPESNPEKSEAFKKVVNSVRNFSLSNFKQDNPAKCNHCIYENACDRSV